MNARIKFVKEKITGMTVFLFAVLGLGKWAEDKLLVPNDAGAWVVMKTTFVAFYKEGLIFLFAIFAIYFCLSFCNLQRIKRELRRSFNGKATILDYTIITFLNISTILILFFRFQSAKYDFNMLRTGQNLFYSLISKEISNEADSKLNEGSFTEAIKLYETAGRLEGGRDMEAAATQLAKIPTILKQISSNLRKGRMAPATHDIFQQIETLVPFYRISDFKEIADQKSEDYFKFLENLKANLQSKNWRGCQHILIESSKSGYEINCHTQLATEILDRISFPRNWDGPDVGGLAEGVLQSMEHASGAYIPHDTIMFCCEFASDTHLDYFEQFRRGVYNPDGLPIVGVDHIDGNHDNSDEYESARLNQTTKTDSDWWRYVAPSGFKTYFRDYSKTPKMISFSIQPSEKSAAPDQEEEEDEDVEKEKKAEVKPLQESNNIKAAIEEYSIKPAIQNGNQRQLQLNNSGRKLPEPDFLRNREPSGEGITIGYRISERDSIQSIAKEFNTTASELRSINHMGPFDRISPGQLFYVPWKYTLPSN